jgi:hypothetical protein
MLLYDTIKFLKTATKVVYQTAKSCQYVTKNVFFCGKEHFLFILLGELAPRTKPVAGALLGGVAPRAEPMGLIFRV